MWYKVMLFRGIKKQAANVNNLVAFSETNICSIFALFDSDWYTQSIVCRSWILPILYEFHTQAIVKCRWFRRNEMNLWLITQYLYSSCVLKFHAVEKFNQFIKQIYFGRIRTTYDW